MDRGTSLLLNLARYSGYGATLWVTTSNRGLGIDGPVLPLLLALAVDSIRSHYLQPRSSRWVSASLGFQLALVHLFILLDGSPIGIIPLVILVADSQVSFGRPVGDRVFGLSLLGFIAFTLVGPLLRQQLTADGLAMTMINSLFLFFAYGVSHLARRQSEDRDRAESALTELERSRKELETAYRQLLDSSKQREQLVLVEERNRLAREIHDTLAHTLTAVIVGQEAAQRLLGVDPARASERLAASQNQARAGLDEVRRSVRALRPRTLEEMGFGVALRGLARQFGPEFRVELDVAGDLSLPPELELTLYRIIQECMTNSQRHGRAGLVGVRLQRAGAGCRLEVSDDGAGCPQLVEGHGMRGIRDRAAAHGGRVEFLDRSPSGFLVVVELMGDVTHGDQDPHRR